MRTRPSYSFNISFNHMAENTNPGLGGDYKGLPVIDPTSNVLKLVEEAVRRINDLHTLYVTFDEKVRQGDIIRANDLRNVEVKRINEALEDHKKFNEAWHDQQISYLDKLGVERELRLQQKFEGLDKAIEKANTATEKRFEGVNEFRNTLSDQQRTFIPRTEYEAGHKNLNDMLTNEIKNLSNIIFTQKERIDAIANRKEGGNIMWILIVGVGGFVMGIISFVLGILGK